jgi:hypothetical protein
MYVAVLLFVSVLVLADCGSSEQHPEGIGMSTVTIGAGRSAPASPAPPAGLAAAERPSAAQFPAAAGKTLQQLADLAKVQAQLGAATGTFTPGDRRVAFGILAANGSFIYAPTALYIAQSPNSAAQGPFPAPADPMTVAARYRSEQNAGPAGLRAIYAANVPLPWATVYATLALTRTAQGLVGAAGEIAVARSFPIPDVGQRPPAIPTDTLASVNGRVSLLTTRIPPEHMQSVSFKDALGKRPIALLFSTPQLCQSRVCGPVTDVVVQLQHEFGNRIIFIHEEVYVNNQPSQGLRPQMKAFHLETEPWLFTVNRHGVIAARLEGAFGTTAVRRALLAALQ